MTRTLPGRDAEPLKVAFGRWDGEASLGPHCGPLPEAPVLFGVEIRRGIALPARLVSPGTSWASGYPSPQAKDNGVPADLDEALNIAGNLVKEGLAAVSSARGERQVQRFGNERVE